MSRRWRGVLVGAVLAGGTVALTRAWPRVAEVTTGETPEYSDLQPRRYAQDRERVFDAALAVAREIRLWQVVHVDRGLGVFRAHATVLPIPFKDEVTVWVQSDRQETVVTVRSRSLLRGARGDLGVNARRIRSYLRRLDGQLRV